MNNIKLVTIILVAFISTQAFAQDKKNKKVSNDLELRNMLDSQRFVFVPSSITPQRGRTRYLDGYFDLRLKNDSLISYLPFFGRADIAPISADDYGIRFTSTDFEYSYKPAKKRSYEVTMKVRDNSNSNKFFLIVYDNLTASLIVTGNFRDQVTFRGYIRPIK